MNLSDTIKTLLLAGVGAAAKTTEKSKEIIDELVKKGELTLDEGVALNEELRHKAEDKKEERVTKSVEKMTKEERDALRAKLDEADKKDAE